MVPRRYWIAALLLASCGGDSGKDRPGPSNPQEIGRRPDSAEMTGTQTQASMPGGPTISTAQDGDTGDAVWCWYDDVDEDGWEEDCCAVEDDENWEGRLRQWSRGPDRERT